MDEEAAPLLETQKTCYDLRAPDYMDLAEPSDRPGRGFLRDDEAAALVNELHPEGDVHLVIGRANQDTVQRSARVFEDTGARRTLTVCRRRAGAPVRSSGGDHNVTGGCRAVRERPCDNSSVLLAGINHVAVLTGDTERFLEFYRDVFGSTHEALQEQDGFKLTLVWVGPTTELNVFELHGNSEHERQVPMFGRGRLDHLALEAASLDAFDTIRERLLAREATDGFVTDFGHILSLFFRDPDGLEAEVCVQNPDAQPGVHHPPGTPSRRHHPAPVEPAGSPDAPPQI